MKDGRVGRLKTCFEHTSEVWQDYILVPASKTKSASKTQCGAWLHKKGRHCTQPAGHGTEHPGYGTCKLHGGMTHAAKVAAGKAELAATMPVMGLPIEVDPLDALIHCVRITAGEIEYCSVRVAELEEKQAVLNREETTKGRSAEKGRYHEKRKSNDASLNIWIKARHDALDRLARFSKMAIDAGVEERQVRVAEQMGTTIGQLIQAILGELQLTPQQVRMAPTIVQAQMARLGAGVGA